MFATVNTLYGFHIISYRLSLTALFLYLDSSQISLTKPAIMYGVFTIMNTTGMLFLKALLIAYFYHQISFVDFRNFVHHGYHFWLFLSKLLLRTIYCAFGSRFSIMVLFSDQNDKRNTTKIRPIESKFPIFD